MGTYAIKDTTLTAIGDAIRERKFGSDAPYFSQEFQFTYTSGTRTDGITFFLGESKGHCKPVKGIISLISEMPDRNDLVWRLNVTGYQFTTLEPSYEEGQYPVEFIMDNPLINTSMPNYITCYGSKASWQSSASGKNFYSPTFRIELYELDDNKEPYNVFYTPSEMADEINNSFEEIKIANNGIYTPSRGKMGFSSVEVNAPLIPDSALNISGNCQYKFYGGGWDWFISDKITTENITNAQYMFSQSKIEPTIPFEINFKENTYADMGYMFDNTKITSLPKMNNVYPSNINSFISYCNYLREIPEDYFDNWNWDRLHTYAYGNMGGVISNLYSLRKLPKSLIENYWGISTSSSYTPYYYFGHNCHSLDEINGLAVQPSKLTSSVFFYFCNGASRVKDIIFATNEDGTAKTAEWKSQTIDLTSYVGYINAGNKRYLLNYNSGITADKEVYDDATYQALKDDPDWFSAKIEYSRYNHDSAVNTINSLPDCSATGINTIKFKGASGALTDDGAINTLTEEEIAVATAKGWTVSLV